MAKGKPHRHHASGKRSSTKQGGDEPAGRPQRSFLNFRGDTLEITPTADRPITLLETEQYETWVDGIADVKTNTVITYHVGKMGRGLFGDWKEVDGVFEMRIDFGPGFRVYYAKHGLTVVILLGGGDKGSQKDDMAAARRLWGSLRDEITEV